MIGVTLAARLSARARAEFAVILAGVATVDFPG
jgi:hypothetical protein